MMGTLRASSIRIRIKTSTASDFAMFFNTS